MGLRVCAAASASREAADLLAYVLLTLLATLQAPAQLSDTRGATTSACISHCAGGQRERVREQAWKRIAMRSHVAEENMHLCYGGGRGLHLQVMSHQAASLDGPFGEVWENG